MKDMMKLSRLALATAAVLALSGCSVIKHLTRGNSTSIASAAPLNSSLVDPENFVKLSGYSELSDKADSGSDQPDSRPKPANGSRNPAPPLNNNLTLNNKMYIGAVVLDSIQKCQAFVSTLDLDQGNANFIGDAFSTLFSSLATVAKPINTVHGLTASATIASGTKNAYLSGYFADATIANLGMAMTTSYYAALQQYLDTLQKMDDSQIILPVEIAKVESIHSLCSMASAEYVISKTLGQATAKETEGGEQENEGATANVSVSINFDPKDNAKVGDKVNLTAILVNTSGKVAKLTDDMAVTLASDPDVVPLQNAKFDGSSCDIKQIKVAPDGKSFAYQKAASIPLGGCSIKTTITSQEPTTVTAQIQSGVLKTDQGSDTKGAGPVILKFASNGVPAPAASTATSPAPIKIPPTIKPVLLSAPVTKICLPKSLGQIGNQCTN